MNVIDDAAQGNCHSAVIFICADDENGNLNEVETSDGTDGDDSTSAPIELLAEFLSAVLQRNYPVALGHCEKILKYEPNNSVAKEFWPLIKLRADDSGNECMDRESSGDDNEDETDKDAGSNNDEEVEESEDTKYYEEGETDGDEDAGEEDPNEDSDSDLGTSTSDGTTDNFSFGDEDDDRSSNTDVKTLDSNGNNTNPGSFQIKAKKEI